ncbi:hypothetical protein GQ607_003401, partial [Colletotrichum asianum]
MSPKNTEDPSIMADIEQTHFYVTVNSVDEEGWIVDVSDNRQRAVLQGVRVTDPLTPGQRATCRWYIEQYVQKSPFSAEKALEAENMMYVYPEKLLASLPLQEIFLLRHDLKQRGAGPKFFYLYICQDAGQCAGTTIHQIFWETLEDPRLWNSDIQVIVQRSISADSSTSAKHTDHIVPSIASDGTVTINLLLVIARDLRRDEFKRQDASPTLAINAILKIRDRLKERRSPIQLNLEIVRPGTLKAFKEHLQRTEDGKGPGYFHIVHFDMHGNIGLQRTVLKKIGVLYFAAPDSDETTAVPVGLVCKIIARHRIPFVVLNACDSANTSNGDQANMAQQFLKRSGARNALGMSFKVASKSAALFLGGFYEALLLDCRSFAVSAAVGRAVLRLNPDRPARYGLRRIVRDSFVAVAYGLSQIAFASELDASPSCSSLVYPSARPDITLSSETSQCIGREFDLLRLEKLLCRSPIVYLSGLAGVGKSTFLEHAASVWKDSHFAEAVVSINLASKSSLSGLEFSTSMLRQFLAQVQLPLHQSCLWSVTSLNLDSCDLTLIDEIIVDIVSKINCVIVLEGLEQLPIDPIPSELSLPATMEVLIKTLLRMAGNLSRIQKCYLIFTHRMADPRGVESLVSHRFGPHCFDLKGLDLPDAIQLSNQILQSNGNDIQQWKHEDADWLESIISLLGSIPLALVTVLPLQQRLAIPWRLFYSRLQGGLFISPQDLQEQCPEMLSCIADFESLSRLPPSLFYMCCLLGMFWNEAVDIIRLLPTFNATATEALKYDLMHGGNERIKSLLLSFAAFILDRGYVRRGQRKYTLQVHPIFTIVGRAFLAGHITLSTRVRLKTMFGASLEALVLDSPCDRFDAGNYVTVVNFCIAEVQVEHWPLRYLTCLGDITRANLPNALLDLLLNTRCKLLEVLTFKFRLLDDKTPYIIFFCISIACFDFRLRNAGSQLLERILVLSLRTDLLPNLEAHDPETYLACRGLLLYVSTSVLWSLGRTENFRESLRSFRSAVEPILVEVPQLGSIWENLRSNLPSGLAAGDEAIERAMEALDQTLESQQLSWDKHVQRWLGLMSVGLAMIEESHSSVIDPGSRHADGWPKSFETAVNRVLADHSPADKSSPTTIGDFYKISMLELLDPSTLSRKSLAETISANKDLDAVEKMYDAGEWFDLCEQHLAVALESFQQLQFLDGLEHLAAIQAILEKTSVPDSLPAAVSACKHRATTAMVDHLYQTIAFPTQHFNIRHSKPKVPEKSDAVKLLNPDGKDRTSISATDVPTVDTRARKTRAFQEWWRWLHEFLGQDVTWAYHIFAHPELYSDATTLMESIHGAACANDYEEVLRQLGFLQNICKDDIFVSFPQVYPLQAVRDAVEVAMEQQRLLKAIHTLIPRDPGAASVMIDDFVRHIPKFCSWVDNTLVDSLRSATGKHILVHFQMRLIVPQTGACLENSYQELCHHLNTGSFDRLNTDIVCRVKAMFLVCLGTQAIARRSWNAGMEYFSEFLRSLPAAWQADATTQAIIRVAKGKIQEERLQDSLDEAEAAFDFARCCRLVEEMENFVADQSNIAEPERGTILFARRQALDFMKESYMREFIAASGVFCVSSVVAPTGAQGSAVEDSVAPGRHVIAIEKVGAVFADMIEADFSGGLGVSII